MNRCLTTLLLIGFMTAGIPSLSGGQTCSCAGAPLISSQSISAPASGNLLLGLTYEYKDISAMYSGDTPIQNPPVSRSTQSYLLEASYGFTDRLSVSATFSFIQKRRESGLQTPGANDVFKTRGVGDGLVLVKYVIHKNTMQSQYQLAAGAGVKPPIGITSRTRSGLQANMDMQPGTGAWDGALWSYFSKTFAPATTLNLFWINSYRFTGSNERFRSSTLGYKFGNTLVSTAGITNQLVSKLKYVVMARYRSAASDRLGNSVQPNTGGKWLSLIPGLNYELSESISLHVSGQIPVYQHLNGIQPSTSYSLSASVFYNFGKRTIF